VSCGHVLVQGQPTDDGVEREIDIHDIEDNELCPKVLYRPEGEG
jgi:hypothetical protein